MRLGKHVDRLSLEVCVVGLIYFECEIPKAPEPIEPGTERHVDHIPLTLGGALNTASVAAALGLSSGVVFPQGRGLSDASVRAALERLPVAAFPFPGRDDPAITLVWRDARERTFLSAADFEALWRCPKLPSARVVHVPGLLEARALEARLVEAKAQKAKVSLAGSWTPEGFAWLRNLVGGASEARFDLIVLNAKEAEAVAGDVAGALEALSRIARTVVVTRGEEGALGRRGDEVVEVPAERARAAADATGAGDAFIAGLLAARCRGRSLAEGLALGAKVAARMLEARGGVAFCPGTLSDLRMQA